jgi:hypothetical protein
VRTFIRGPWLEAVNLAAAAVGFWVAVIFPLWMIAELEIPGQQYADPVLPVFYCASLLAGPTIPIWHIWRVWLDRAEVRRG